MWAAIASAVGELLGPILRETLPFLFDYWRSPPDAKRIKATKEQDHTTEVVNDEWGRILQEYDVPDDYSADLRM